MGVKVFDEVTKKFEAGNVQDDCPIPHDPFYPVPATPVEASPHYFASDAPDENDVCQCGRFFYCAAKSLAGE